MRQLVLSGLMVVNVSVWRTYEQLHAYVYRSHHGALVKQRDRC